MGGVAMHPCSNRHDRFMLQLHTSQSPEFKCRLGCPAKINAYRRTKTLRPCDWCCCSCSFGVCVFGCLVHWSGDCKGMASIMDFEPFATAWRCQPIAMPLEDFIRRFSKQKQSTERRTPLPP
eukprot:GHVT01094832.1.p1 GENE.GHVT01094832.1~~GHVT01094832.1.p1  ORF type:complete len:122 (-),score=7.27 GHVT01094832.1:147-512(-)